MTDLDRLDAQFVTLTLDEYRSLVAENKALREVEKAARALVNSSAPPPRTVAERGEPTWYKLRPAEIAALRAALHHKDGAS